MQCCLWGSNPQPLHFQSSTNFDDSKVFFPNTTTGTRFQKGRNISPSYGNINRMNDPLQQNLSKAAVQKKTKNWGFKTDYRITQVKSIAECSKEHSAILSTFIKLPLLLLLRPLFCLFLSDYFRQVLLYLLTLSHFLMSYYYSLSDLPKISSPHQIVSIFHPSLSPAVPGPSSLLLLVFVAKQRNTIHALQKRKTDNS